MYGAYQTGTGTAKASRPLWWVLGLGLSALVIGGGLYLFLTRSTTPPVNPGTLQAPAQQQPPASPLEVSLTGVESGQVVDGQVTIGVEVNELPRVGRVEYFIDGVFEAVTYATPFSFTLDTAGLIAGEHTITARVYDKNGAVFEAQVITIQIGESAASAAAQTGSSSGQRVATSSGASSSGGSSSESGGSNNSGGSDDSNNEEEPEEENQGGGGISNGGNAADTTAPTAPANLLLSATDGYTVSLAWDASTDNVGVDEYQVFRDDVQIGTAESASYTDQTVVPGNEYEYAVKAIDDANNLSSVSNEPEVTLEPTSIWIDGDTPSTTGDDPVPLELGVKFRPLVNGKITGVRFYKDTHNNGVHVGRLWTIGGVSLATVTFTGESASGWQEATFATPVDVIAGTTYVVSYTSPNGTFSATSQYFQSAGITSEYMTALASGVSGNNGVYAESAGTFPSSSFNNTNYWVDAMFAPNVNAGGPDVQALDNSAVYAGYPGSNNTGVPVGKRLPSRDRGMLITRSNTIVENIEVNETVEIRAANVTIRKARINGLVYLDTNQGGSATWAVTVQDTEVNAGTVQRGAISLGQFTIERSNIHGGQASALCGGDCSITDSWLHGQYVPDGEDWHLDAFISNGGSDMTLSHNTLACDNPGNDDGGSCSAAVGLFGDFAAITNVVIDDNLFIANTEQAYCLYGGYDAGKAFGDDAANIDVTNNVFQRGTNNKCGGFGHVSDFALDSTGLPSPGSAWTGNTWSDGAVAPDQ